MIYYILLRLVVAAAVSVTCTVNALPIAIISSVFITINKTVSAVASSTSNNNGNG